MRMTIGEPNVYNFEMALRGMRLSHQSHSDSFYDHNEECFIVGPNDLELIRRLAGSGGSHRKFLRAITVSFECKLPLFLWSEFDTYKHVVRLSDSTMHNLLKRPLTQDDFEEDISEDTLKYLNLSISSDKDVVNVKNMLPSGYLLTSVITTNYETLLNMYQQRRTHRLPEWKKICDWIYKLPLMKEILEAYYEKN